MLGKSLIGLMPAAGEGSRLGLPYPKELQPLFSGGLFKPAAQFGLEAIRDSGAAHVVMVVNHTKHQLLKYFGSGLQFGCQMSYVVQETKTARDPSRSGGLAEALDAAHHLTRCHTVLFAMADTVILPTTVFAEMMTSAHAGDDVVLGLFRVDRPENFGMVEMREDDRVVRVVDKPASTRLEFAWACIVWGPRFTEHLHDRVSEGEGDFAAILNGAISAGMQVRGAKIEHGHFADLGTTESVMKAQRWFEERE